MRKLLPLFLVLTALNLFAQNKEIAQRSIEVTGSATMEIVPDEVSVEIVLKEYFKEEFEGKKVKRFKTKVNIETLENELFQNLKNKGVKNDEIVISALLDFGSYKGKETLIGKSYIITLNSFKKANDLIKGLNFKGLEDIRISGYDHSKITEYRKQTKINAIKAARDKAQYLLEAIGSKLGKPIEIKEDVDTGYDWNTTSRSNIISSNNSNSYAGYSYAKPSSKSKFAQSKKIVLRYEIYALFEIE
ncbi:SIMPL domain-containing protein [Aureivirga sp. CE67]|uniref:SIMPL domain-containing protein n=1 Tax=Aureivirga sp. CE67 TaxID=1788983 RepID=UPI0018CB16B8|nr:SIMPL domain-containing protein [Aureivirga sp. CE67]